MQQNAEQLAFNLIEFDACKFITEMAGIATPVDTIPTFDTLYGDHVGQVNDFECVAFYCNFTCLASSRIFTPNINATTTSDLLSNFV